MKDAYETMILYDAAKEKVFGEESSRKIAQMEIALDLQEKEKELEVIKSQSQIQALQLKNTQMVIIVAVLGLAVLLGGLNLFYSRRKSPRGK